MVLDSSAIAAILFDEPEAPAFEVAIERASVRLISAGSLVELSIVVELRLGEPRGRELDLLLYRAGIEIVPLTREQAEIARRAFRRFGKGRHPAALNFGDCFSYALSKTAGGPFGLGCHG
ncbi:MAG: type II toxin-antitoxin system VapC family toxin, partial [Acidobacteriota bacterium]